MEKQDKKTGTCFFGHKWTKWTLQEVEEGHVIGDKLYKGVNMTQTRRCLKCGKYQQQSII